MLIVFNLGFGQSRLIMYAPVDRPCALVNETAFDKTREQARRLGFVLVRHGAVWILPFPENAKPLKVARLSLQSIGGKFAAGSPNTERRHIFLFFTELAFDMQFDRQAVKVVSR